MRMLNRRLSPAYHQIDTISFIQPVQYVLQNGIPVYTFNEEDKELVRIEFIFANVNWDSTQPLQAIGVNSLFNSGTASYSAEEIAAKIDYYGAFMQSDYGADHLTITVYSLERYLESLYPILKSLFTVATFPQGELDIYIQNQKQKLQVNLQKNDFLARKAFANAIFGDTPYGADITAAHYDGLSREALLAYYEAAFKPDNCTIIASGKFGASQLALTDRIFGKDWHQQAVSTPNHFQFAPQGAKKIALPRPDSVQNAIRLGGLAIQRHHPDFPALQVLNTVLGGYFGSRLMANIREDKGYTYGIGSGLASLKHAGYFFISTEVGSEVAKAALTEIYHEMDRLRNEHIGQEELDRVRNYMLGSLLGSLENIFSHADKFKNLLFSGLDYPYYERYIATVKEVDAPTLLGLAQTYFDPENFTELIVGKI